MRSRFWTFLVGWLVLVPTGFTAEPASDEPTPREVLVGVNLTSIPEIQETSETFVAICYLHLRWQDPSLAFEGKRPQVLIEEAALDRVKEMWRPDLQFANESSAAEVKRAVLSIHPDGTVDFDREFQVTLRSELDLHSFPFDRQVLQLELESFAYNAKEVRLVPEQVVLGRNVALAQWQPGELSWSTAMVQDRLEAEDYHRLTISLEMTRNPGFYIWQVFVPLFFLIMIASTVFFLPAEDLADRINVIVTSLLTVVALSYAVHADLPKIAYLTAIDRLFIVAFVFLGAKILSMLLVKELMDSQPGFARTFDRRARWAFPGAYLLVNAAVILASVARG